MGNLLNLLENLEKECFGEGPSPPYTRAILEEVLGNPAYRLLIACPDRIDSLSLPSSAEAIPPCNDPPGYLIARRFPEDGFEELHRVGVPARFRRNGWGRRLIEAWIDEARETGGSGGETRDRPSDMRLHLEVSEDNTAARRLYESLGFVRIGLRRAYYSDRSAALMYDLDLSV